MNARVETPRERIVRSEAVVPATMSAAERDALADGLLAVYSEIFAGATREFIVEGMVAPKSEFTTILLHRNAEDRIVGYFAIHCFERRFRGVPTIVVRSSVGMLRAYRGRNANIRWALGVLLKQRLRHPGSRCTGWGRWCIRRATCRWRATSTCSGRGPTSRCRPTCWASSSSWPTSSRCGRSIRRGRSSAPARCRPARATRSATTGAAATSRRRASSSP
ncbi:hypothetical protein [Nannocystis pusilla]|uniref:hypothetical protein n=1 Tax=Nannocystis pusilla TaxID=889268 RepID=UPI003B75D910